MIQEYYRATTKNDALQKIKAGFRPVGGGTFISQHQQGITSVVDLQGLELNSIHAEGDRLIIGASATFQALIGSDLVTNSLKLAIRREMKINLRNSVTVAGHLCLNDGFSIVQGWLYAAGVKINVFPTNQYISLQTFNTPESLSKDGFIQAISIEDKVNVNWDVISRTPDDVALVGVFINQRKDDSLRIVLTGFNQHIHVLDLFEKEGAASRVKDYLLNAHSHYSNKFISYNYYFKNSLTLLERLLKGIL